MESVIQISIQIVSINIEGVEFRGWITKCAPNLEILEISRDVEEIGYEAEKRVESLDEASISPPPFTERRVTRPRWPWYARDSSGGFAEHASSSFQRIRFLAPASFLSFLPRDFPTGDDSTALWIPCPGTTWYHTCLSADRSLSPPPSNHVGKSFSSRRDKGRHVPRNELSRSLAAISSRRRPPR